MKKIIAKGNRPLCGEVTASGSKNAALPILFATLAVNGRSVIKNLPDIGDVRVAIEILKGLGAKITRSGTSVTVDTSSVEYRMPPAEQIAKIRASTYLIGACLARFGICHLCEFGGCDFAPRPIDLHLLAAQMLGATVEDELVCAKELRASKITLPKISVGATVNALIMCATLSGKSEIFGYAKEMHVMNLIDFLRSGGAEITVLSDRITVRGSTLIDASVTVIPDMIEAGTYAIGAIASGGDVRVFGADGVELSPLNRILTDSGATVETGDGFIRYTGRIKREIDLLASPYPGFPTDLQPPMAIALALFRGGRIRDAVFPERFGYLSPLSHFGIRSSVAFSCAHIYPSSPLRAASVSAPDLRGGVACLLAALCAEGESVISSAERIFRGYDSLVKKLTALGADVCESGKS